MSHVYVITIITITRSVIIILALQAYITVSNNDRGAGTNLKVGWDFFLSRPSTFWLYKYN